MTVQGQSLIINQPLKFFVEECIECGTPFAVLASFQAQRFRDKTTFYCPAGHAQNYLGKSDEQKANEADAARRRAEVRLASERDQRLAAERELKRHQQRAKGGACPCCNRTFVQLARHMKTKHPGFTA